MRLRVVTPTEVLVDEEVDRVSARGAHGYFCLLPRHVDFAAALVPGLLTFRRAGGEEVVAADDGVLVKEGPKVTATVREAVRGGGLEDLRAVVAHRFLALDERERRARAALALLEAGLLRRFLELR